MRVKILTSFEIFAGQFYMIRDVLRKQIDIFVSSKGDKDSVGNWTALINPSFNLTENGKLVILDN